MNSQNEKSTESKVDSWIKSWNPYNPERVNAKDMEPVTIQESKIRKRAARWFFIGFAIFVVWAFFAPIDQGVTATGQVVVSGYRKSVQHPTGGVVREILVNEGDSVKKDQVLIRVNPLNAQATLSKVQSDLINVLVTEARLRAERNEASSINWPKELNALGNKEKIIESKITQDKLFNIRRREVTDTIANRKEQQKSLIEEEKNLAQLAKEGYVPRAAAEQALRNRLESQTAVTTFKSNYLKQLETELNEMQKQHDSLVVQLAAAEFDEQHANIKSPVDGKIVGLKVFTVGGVVGGGQVLAEVVPQDSKLVIDVNLPATVIDRVKVGEIVDLHFTAFNAVTTPTVPGRVMKVGADKQIPDKTKPGAPDFEYYSGQIETTPEGLKMLGDLNIQPGMTVDVVIKTGERNFISWVLKPISDRLIWAFK